jgi:hypothetical protein
MKINELFEEIQNNLLPEELNGEFQLQGNCIVWTYNLDDDSEEIDAPIGDDDDESGFSFEATPPEELLQEACHKDKELLNQFFEDIEESDKWTVSEPETGDYTISFKIF